MNVRWRLLILILAVAGCTNNKPLHQDADRSTHLKHVMPDELRAVATNFADGYVLDMGQAYDELIKATGRQEVADWAMDQKIATAMAAYTNATSPNPAVSCIDLIILTSLKRIAIERHWLPSLLNEEGDGVLAAAKSGEADAWAMAAKALTSRQQADLRATIDDWVVTHPKQYYVGWVAAAF